MLKIQFICLMRRDNSNDMIITVRFGVLSECFNRLGHLASKSRESYNFIRNEILKLTDKLQKEVGLHHNGYDASNDYCDPLVVKTKGVPSKKNVKKKSRKCSNCNLTGHVASTCPILLFMDYDFSSSEDTTELDHAGVINSDQRSRQQMLNFQYPQYLPINENYRLMNMAGASSWSDLLQNVMNGGTETSKKPG
ncbi:uncharacterized protein LOC109806972 isoform X1 [Cajanus cajan]|uniref:uncharacterized protein LOC109806972 isoform X1 n=1 Tax=Cajanus cajan TaxID=3821 RepID=UPI0010FB1C6B|nr:uncharacterized protein LOC109806972 isoform X1 [Cajanus cajan]